MRRSVVTTTCIALIYILFVILLLCICITVSHLKTISSHIYIWLTKLYTSGFNNTYCLSIQIPELFVFCGLLIILVVLLSPSRAITSQGVVTRLMCSHFSIHTDLTCFNTTSAITTQSDHAASGNGTTGNSNGTAGTNGKCHNVYVELIVSVVLLVLYNLIFIHARCPLFIYIDYISIAASYNVRRSPHIC